MGWNAEGSPLLWEWQPTLPSQLPIFLSSSQRNPACAVDKALLPAQEPVLLTAAVTESLPPIYR